MKALINNQIVDVKILKERKLFWLFEQVLVEYEKEIQYMQNLINFYKATGKTKYTSEKWIPKSNLIEDYD